DYYCAIWHSSAYCIF
nr:immunoglobulin light chain junction region [Macaca mulatta]MOX78607.1 immunoglobulin light chain junction region [Macaca mulatta]MOX79339.1 immunoglobulin light chain junction region [Macaca mulatta]MOX79470.1 immunoglobulin light chain junction region [Macaca mulatta]MOX80146.1 immunoglobulin light chain junction region [Macaca mulatta]